MMRASGFMRSNAESTAETQAVFDVQRGWEEFWQKSPRL